MKKPHYAWIICAACTLQMFSEIGFTSNAFAVFNPFLNSLRQITYTQISLLAMVRNIVSLFSLLFVTQIFRLLGLRASMLVTELFTAAGFLLYAFSENFGLMCVASGLLGVAFGAGGMMLVSALIPNWFGSHRALALGICGAGSGIAYIVLPSVLTAVISAFSLKAAFLGVSFFSLLSGGLCFAFVRDTPAQIGLQPLREPDRKQGRNARPLPVRRRAVSPHAVLFGMIVYGLFGLMASPLSASISMLLTTSGYSSPVIAAYLTVYGVALTLSKLIYGQMTDRLGNHIASMTLFGLIILGGTLLCFPSSQTAAFAGTVIFALGLPLSTIGVPLIAAEVAPEGGYLTTLRAMQITLRLSAIATSAVPGLLADRTGSYVPSFALGTALTAAAAAVLEAAYHGGKQAKTDSRS